MCNKKSKLTNRLDKNKKKLKRVEKRLSDTIVELKKSDSEICTYIISFILSLLRQIFIERLDLYFWSDADYSILTGI